MHDLTVSSTSTDCRYMLVVSEHKKTPSITLKLGPSSPLIAHSHFFLSSLSLGKQWERSLGCIFHPRCSKAQRSGLSTCLYAFWASFSGWECKACTYFERGILGLKPMTTYLGKCPKYPVASASPSAVTRRTATPLTSIGDCSRVCWPLVCTMLSAGNLLLTTARCTDNNLCLLARSVNIKSRPPPRQNATLWSCVR